MQTVEDFLMKNFFNEYFLSKIVRTKCVNETSHANWRAQHAINTVIQT